jgi:hypothetical protein
MGRKIFHIGFHKTATTWFQENYYPNIDDFIVVDRKTLQEDFIEPHALNFNPNKVASKYANNNYLFADEEMSGNIHNAGLNGYLTKEIAHRIKLVFPDAEIIIFIRNQEDMVRSIYTQYVKKGGTFKLKSYLHHSDNYNHRSPMFMFEHLNYFNIVELYKNLFGSACKVYLYEDFLQNHRNFLSKLCKDLKIKPVDYYDVTKKNLSYGCFSIILRRALNIFSKKDVPNKYYIVNIPLFNAVLDRIFSLSLRLWPNCKYKLPSRQLIFIKEYYKESNTKLEKYYGLKLKEYGYSTYQRVNKNAEK